MEAGSKACSTTLQVVPEGSCLKSRALKRPEGLLYDTTQRVMVHKMKILCQRKSFIIEIYLTSNP